MADDRSVVPSWRLLILLVAVPCLVILGADRTWTGAGGNNNFSTGNNWAPLGTPVPGDRLVFPAATPTVAPLNNDIPGLSTGGMSFDGNNPYVVTGLPLSVSGTISTGPATTTADHLIQVPVTFTGPVTVSPLNPTAGIIFQAQVSGPFPLTTSGGGWTVLGTANTYLGPTLIQSGTLWTQNLNSLGSPLGGGATVGAGGTLYLGAPLDPNMPVSLQPAGTISAGAAASLGTLTVPGLGSAILSAPGWSLFVQALQGSGLLVISGGHQRILGPGSYSGSFTVQGTTLFEVNGAYPAANVLVNSPFTTVGGVGTIASLSVNQGTVSPGNSPGLLSANGNVAYLNLGTCLFSVELNGITPGSGYDQLAVTGNVNLGSGTNLSGSRTHNYGLGETLDIITATGTITGTFQGLPENATISMGGQTFRVNYLTNAVRLTAITVVPVALQSFSVD